MPRGSFGEIGLSRQRVILLFSGLADIVIILVAGILGSAGFRLLSTVLFGLSIAIMFVLALAVIVFGKQFYLEEQYYVAKLPSGTCHKCGYDLTGNLSGVCPECGAVVVSEHTMASDANKTSREISVADVLGITISLMLFGGGVKLSFSQNDSASAIGIVTLLGFGAATIGFAINLISKMRMLKK